MGAITGRLLSPLFVPSQCYWNPIAGIEGIGFGTGATNYSSFNGTKPTLQMASDMNKAWEALIPDTKFLFNEYGEIVAYNRN